MVYLLVFPRAFEAALPQTTNVGPGDRQWAESFLHAAGVEVPALRTLVVRLDRQHLDALAPSGTDRALGVGVDGAGGRCRLGFHIALSVTIAGVGHAASIPDPTSADGAPNQRLRRAPAARAKATAAKPAKSRSVPGPGRPPASEQPLL